MVVKPRLGFYLPNVYKLMDLKLFKNNFVVAVLLLASSVACWIDLIVESTICISILCSITTPTEAFKELLSVLILVSTLTKHAL